MNSTEGSILALVLLTVVQLLSRATNRETTVPHANNRPYVGVRSAHHIAEKMVDDKKQEKDKESEHAAGTCPT